LFFVTFRDLGDSVPCSERQSRRQQARVPSKASVTRSSRLLRELPRRFQPSITRALAIPGHVLVLQRLCPGRLCSMPSPALPRPFRQAHSWKSTPDEAQTSTMSKDALLNARREDERLARRLHSEREARRSRTVSLRRVLVGKCDERCPALPKRPASRQFNCVLQELGDWH
jgi:hypothetical protein